jgi:hypothetical protein
MKKLFCFLVVAFIAAGSAAYAQEVDSTAIVRTLTSDEDVTNEQIGDRVPSISLDTRFGYEHIISERSGGFGGDGLFLNVDGKISKHFSYSLCHRLFESIGEDVSVFDATDWVTLAFDVKGFSFSAGKDYIMLGSWEYDTYDLDSYFDMNTMFYNSFEGRQWGVTASWTNKSESSTFMIQATNSPFSESPKESNLYAYGVGWQGAWDWYESYWTVNMWEYAPGAFVKNIALGNMFYIGDVSIMADFMMRGTKFKSITDDMSFTIMPAYEFCDRFRLFGKFGWERLRTNMFGDELFDGTPFDASGAVMPDFLISGDDYLFYGAGLEYYPLKDNKDIRLHAAWASNNYTKRHGINIGLTWKFDVTKAISSLVSKRK